MRKGVSREVTTTTVSPDIVGQMTLDQFFDYLGVRLNAQKAAGKTITINFQFTDTGEEYVLELANSVLNHTAGAQRPDADATLTLTRGTLTKIMLRQVTLPEALVSGEVKIAGNAGSLGQLFGLLDTFDFWFPLVTPQRASR